MPVGIMPETCGIIYKSNWHNSIYFHLIISTKKPVVLQQRAV